MFNGLITPGWFIFLMAASLLAGFIDSIAGGGGLITLPAYVLTGLPMHMIYACNKFASAGGTTIATVRYYRNRMVDIPVGLTAALGAFIFSVVAARIVLILNESTLKIMVLVILPAVAVFTLMNRKMGEENLSGGLETWKKYLFAFLIGGFIGMYDGLVGPGTGTFAMIAFCLIMKYDMRTANGNAKFLNLASNCAALTVYLFAGNVFFGIAVPAALFNILGNYIGSGIAIKKGTKVIRIMLVVVMVLLFSKIITDLVMA